MLSFLVSVTAAVWIGITRNLYCNPEALAGITPPFGGELMPRNLTLKERKYFFQFTKLVDVYDENMTYVGYFYDINLFIIMRFGFSDPSRRIWFEARYASILSRFKPIIEYNLQRCDAGAGPGAGWLFQVRELWMEETYWRCFLDCDRLFSIARRAAGAEVVERLLPPADFGADPEAHAAFDATVAVTSRGRITGPVRAAGLGLRQRWRLRVTNSTGGAEIAAAAQHLGISTLEQDLAVVSTWQLRAAGGAATALPSWVVCFMAVLDDIQED